MKFGEWTFLEEVRDKHEKFAYKCRCKCGVIKIVNKRNLKNGKSKKCVKCANFDRSKVVQMIGSTFGEYIVLNKAESNQKDTHYNCKCSCGTKKVVRGTDLRKGSSHRCHDCAMNKIKKHGMCGTPTYKTWKSMKYRCLNPNSRNYRLYGARGIKICDPWNDFKSFFDDMGIRPLGKELDRIDPDGNYEPRNCRWVTKKENVNNRRCSLVYKDIYVYKKIEDLCDKCK